MPPQSPFARTLARRAQLLIVAGIVLFVAGIFSIGSLVSWFVTARSNAASAEAPSATTPGTFRPTDTQWEGLKIAPVQLLSFRTEHTTEGKIANDDDTTTPVFSPYSGRVIKLYAKAGDSVTQGAPLLALHASEFVQAQNDLIAAIGTLNTTRAQLNLAQTTEKRQHDLYDSKGGALKDWQQSQVDLANAEGNSRSAEIALAAVRNRLRILGKSDAEITAIENAPDRLNMNPEAIVYAPITGTVTQRQVGLGQYIESAASGASVSIFSIGDMSRVWLLANVREVDAPSMRLGEAVEVHVLAYPGRVFQAFDSFSLSPASPSLLVAPWDRTFIDRTLRLSTVTHLSRWLQERRRPMAPAAKLSASCRAWISRDNGGRSSIPSRSTDWLRKQSGTIPVSKQPTRLCGLLEKMLPHKRDHSTPA
jgi:cobalt-zinc-cadmium efflux system membrane fusion protein